MSCLSPHWHCVANHTARDEPTSLRLGGRWTRMVLSMSYRTLGGNKTMQVLRTSVHAYFVRSYVRLTQLAQRTLASAIETTAPATARSLMLPPTAAFISAGVTSGQF